MIRTFQLLPPGVPHVRNDASDPQQQKVELWARNFREFCRKWRLPRHFWVILHAVNLRHGADGFTSEGRRAEDFFARKIRRLRPGLNTRTRVPKASTLTSRPPKPLTDALISQIYSGAKLYMFRAVPLPIIRSYPLYIRHWHVLYRCDDSLRAHKLSSHLYDTCQCRMDSG